MRRRRMKLSPYRKEFMPTPTTKTAEQEKEELSKLTDVFVLCEQIPANPKQGDEDKVVRNIHWKLGWFHLEESAKKVADRMSLKVLKLEAKL